MRLLGATIFKEFLQLTRNRIMLFLVLVSPLVILGVIPLSFDGDYRIRAGVCAVSSDSESAVIIDKMAASAMFEKILFFETVGSAEKEMERGELDMILVLSSGGNNLILDGTYPRRAMNSVFATAVEGFSNSEIKIVFQTIFNEGKRYKDFYLVSLIILVITILATALITLNIVNERECGVEEQFKATLLNRRVYILGKAMFYTALCLVEFILCYLFCFFVYDLEVQGTIFALFVVSLLFLFPLLGMGLLISSFSNTQLRAVYILTISLVLLIMMSTMFTHLSSMPPWAAATRFINPVWYGVESSRQVVLMGASLYDVRYLLLGMILTGFLFTFGNTLRK